jgi:hypothetical protein
LNQDVLPADEEVTSQSATGPVPAGHHGLAAFTTTHWSVVLEAQGESPAAQEALEKLCRIYWRPIYTFVRRQGGRSEEAQDPSRLTPFTSATARAAVDERVCSVGMLNGLYLSSWDGYANFDGTQVPKAIMEGKRFNGDGTFINDFGTVNIGGTTILNTGGFGGTYTVAADCTGTLSVPDGPSFNIYVAPGAQKFWFIQTVGTGATGLGVGTATRLPN